tara:strand:- start:411 stop:653 length:243 start_codon:yes stop_codon:yes gene_type:complete
MTINKPHNRSGLINTYSALNSLNNQLTLSSQGVSLLASFGMILVISGSITKRLILIPSTIAKAPPYGVGFLCDLCGAAFG